MTVGGQRIPGLGQRTEYMTYKQAYEYIEECASYGISPGLDSIRELCERLGDPQDELKFIHIAGTNGKGSIAAYISSILKCAGFRTGRYISPTICDYLERFSVNERSMSKADFARFIDTVRPVCDEMVSEGLPHPTPFEIETAIAFLYFKEKKCDLVVLECGMGGRLDATNIVKNKCLCVFAHIDMDHMQFLGDTLEDITRQKAGIIRDGVPVVTGPQYPEVLKVLRQVSTQTDPIAVTDIKFNLKGGTFKMSAMPDYETAGSDGSRKASHSTVSNKKWHTPLLGIHQIYNAATAIRAIEVLRKSEPETFGRCDDALIQKGLDTAKWPARMQIVSRRPLTIIDGAHNPDAARRLKESLDELIPGSPRILIMGMLKDKDIDEVAKIMCPGAAAVFTVTPPENVRAMRSPDLAAIVSKYNPNVTSLDSPEEAVEISNLVAKEHDDCVIIAFGSLSYMGRMIKIYERR